MSQNCLLVYISMKLRENLSTLPILDQPPPFSFLPPFYRNFRTPPPFSQFWVIPTPPPLGRGGPTYEIQLISFFRLFTSLQKSSFCRIFEISGYIKADKWGSQGSWEKVSEFVFTLEKSWNSGEM